MPDWQFWTLLIAVVVNSYFTERRLDAIQKQNAILIRRLVLRD